MIAMFIWSADVRPCPRIYTVFTHSVQNLRGGGIRRSGGQGQGDNDAEMSPGRAGNEASRWRSAVTDRKSPGIMRYDFRIMQTAGGKTMMRPAKSAFAKAMAMALYVNASGQPGNR